jgi:steroid delta-isomerase-like uncharacterized protein
MSTEDNKALVRRLLEAGQSGNWVLLAEVMAEDVLDHYAFPGQAPGLEGVKQGFEMFRAAFPDLQITIEDMIAEGDKVASRLRVRGTHQGEFFGIPPTGRQVSISAIHIHRIAGGKVREHWGNNDDLGLLQQFGVIPPMG